MNNGHGSRIYILNEWLGRDSRYLLIVSTVSPSQISGEEGSDWSDEENNVKQTRARSLRLILTRVGS